MNMPMNNPKLITEPLPVLNRLAEIGLPRELLMEVVDRMTLARRDTTENFPIGSSGYLSWAHGSARLREVFIPLGWERNSDAGVPSIFKDGIRVAVCNTDDGTGSLDRGPQFRSKKGAGTEQVIAMSQGIFSGILEEAANVVVMPGLDEGAEAWFLCVYDDRSEVRAELVRPAKLESGYFKGFHERIFLTGSIEGDGPGSLRKVDDSPVDGADFPVEVLRKQA